MIDNKKYCEFSTRQSQPLKNDQLATCLITDKAMLKWEEGRPSTCVTLPLEVSDMNL